MNSERLFKNSLDGSAMVLADKLAGPQDVVGKEPDT
jgi:hypothetical protein